MILTKLKWFILVIFPLIFVFEIPLFVTSHYDTYWAMLWVSFCLIIIALSISLWIMIEQFVRNNTKMLIKGLNYCICIFIFSILLLVFWFVQFYFFRYVEGISLIDTIISGFIAGFSGLNFVFSIFIFPLMACE
ncbi:hypothetical protein SHELI_v1c05400 [Spiroplasma helicoides]|uniref:Transmembrane protein n=1 Tax=Spiroplasma helicoides TaxID=216938 RepID=A0A1B3SKN9_9MOLU|nr:hypothetical protein [Spiroplasma helicoides]AOG60491.1 hypothetical protein SHELI_v1c05400 [Spiroplasma helicoides]